jgi:hypothetical protein
MPNNCTGYLATRQPEQLFERHLKFLAIGSLWLRSSGCRLVFGGHLLSPLDVASQYKTRSPPHQVPGGQIRPEVDDCPWKLGVIEGLMITSR